LNWLFSRSLFKDRYVICLFINQQLKLNVNFQLACFEGDLEKTEELLHSISEESKENAALTCWEIAVNFYKQVNTSQIYK